MRRDGSSDVASGDDICLHSLSDVAARIRTRALSPVEVVSAVIERIDRLAPKLNCYITVTADTAMRQARAMEELLAAGTYLGALHGIPISVKDNIPTEGVRTTVGSAILSDSVPSKSATVVQRLTAAGAIVVGKNNLYDFAYCAPNPLYGSTHNPWKLDRSCAGSSSGSASAVAAGLCYGSVGTDGGGSIRMPAAFCGIVGLKPTFGLIPMAGVAPLHPTLSVTGPMTRTVRDAAIMLQTMAGSEGSSAVDLSRSLPKGSYTAKLEDGVKGLRLGVAVGQVSEVMHPEVRSVVVQAYGVLEDQGAVLSEVEMPDFTAARTLMWIISGAEAAEHLRPHLRAHPKLFHPITYSLLRRAELIPATEYVHAQRVRQKFIKDVRAVMSGIDCLLLPATPTAAYAIGLDRIQVEGSDEEPLSMSTRYTTLFNLTGQPALVLPCGLTSERLPVGLQIAGHPFMDAVVLRVARAYERATRWHSMHPPGLEISELDETSERG